MLRGLAPDQLERILELARRHLDMDAAYVAELRAGHQICRAASGEAHSFGIAVDRSAPEGECYGPLMLRAAIPNAVSDTTAVPVLRRLPVTDAAGIGAYLGVPIALSDGSVFGSFSCVSHAPHELGERDVRFLAMLAELVAAEVETARERAESAAQISELIAKRELDVALQPIFRLDDRCLLGVEALARFPAGYGSTEGVFALAASVGLGLPLERLALDSALACLPSLRPREFLAVNLTPAVALDLAARGVQRVDLLKRLVLEMTEHAAIASYAVLREALRPFRRHGLRLAIDDAGAGYASLKHVVELEPDIIKIDRSLVHGVADDRARRSVVSAFVLLALDIGASVIAEGVERPVDLAALTDLGVDAAQGYLLGRPTTERAALAGWRVPTFRAARRRDLQLPRRPLAAQPLR